MLFLLARRALAPDDDARAPFPAPAANEPDDIAPSPPTQPPEPEPPA